MSAVWTKALVTYAVLSFIGTAADGGILAYHLVLALRGQAMLMADVLTHLQDHLPFLSWLKPLADVALGKVLSDWFFGLPAIVYFPGRMVFSIVTGWLALRCA